LVKQGDGFACDGPTPETGVVIARLDRAIAPLSRGMTMNLNETSEASR